MTLVDVFRTLLNRDDDEVDQHLQNFFCKMFGLGRVLCFLLAILFTIVAVITNNQNNNRRVPIPKPFFNRNTWIEDFYEGELYFALLKASKYDVIFLMLYAPWDADSQDARIEFENACKYFHKKIYCAAVNCWQTNPGCKAFFDNIVMYPMFVADLHHIPPIKYQGEIVASHMIRFLSVLMKPIRRIHSVKEFIVLESICDATVVSYFSDYNFYKNYYVASLRILEYDPRREVCWAMTTDKSVATMLSIEKPSIELYLWNETHVLDKSLTSSNIVKWILQNSRMLTQWMFFKNIKQNSLSELVQHNPAVVLFTPNHMYLEYMPSYLLFKEAVMDFENCLTNTDTDERRMLMDTYRQKMIKDDKMWLHICHARYTTTREIFNSRILSVLYDYKRIEKILISTGKTNLTVEYNLKALVDSLRIPISSRSSNTFKASDDRSAQNLVLEHVHEKCKKFRALVQYPQYPDFAYLFSRSKPKDEYSYCDELRKLNNTYTYFAVDSVLYSHLAHALGINLEKRKHSTTLVIFDHQNEETFVLAKEFNSKKVLHEFLIESVKHLIPRWRKSSTLSMYLHRYNKTNSVIPDEVAVLELDSDSFQSVVFQESQHVFVYYYTPYCSYCQVRANAFLHVAHDLRNYPGIKFARIDGENNDLPWHLVPLSYPTIMFFPAKRKSQSVIYPSNRELTTENLLDFVLSNVDSEVKLDFMLDKCTRLENPWKISRTSLALMNCVEEVKAECLEVIGNLVTKYRKVTTGVLDNINGTFLLERILSRLKYFKSFYFRLDKITYI